MKFSVISVFLACAIMATFGDIRTEHKNITCETLDPSYVVIPVCRLTELRRGIIGANVHMKFLKLPIRKASVNFSVWRKLTGYHPFLFNVTLNFCHYMKHPNPLHVFYYFYGAMLPFINVNHTCPINHDVILKDFVLDDQMFSKVPLPKGSYMFIIKFITEGVWRGTVHSYLDINVDD
ncbi:GL17349 [Drosophila persimilis]|uniref:GL17349 n=2 Tax=Drosophila persimilis TaxID=7234 RepID=B4GGI0_DROPE|nr:GL17349 [Drosophila persimilis]